MSSKIQFKRGSAAAFYTLNPTLLRGEPGLELDTNKIKYGDGVTPWRDLPYADPALELVDGGEYTAGPVPAVPGEFSPASVAGLKLWLAADSADYAHVFENKLSLWEDMSESGVKFVQSAANSRPIITNQLNNKVVATFDGANDALIGNLELPEEFTLLVAFRRRGGSTHSQLLAAYDTNYGNRLVLCGSGDGNSFGVRHGDEYLATQPVDNLVPAVYSLQFSLAGLATRLNGLNTQSDTGLVVPALSRLVLGAARPTITDNNYSGDIAEVILYDGVLDAADLIDVENYLMTKWGAVQLAHPLLTGLKAFWRLNEESGARLDITSAQVPLTQTGTVGSAPGVIENAAEFTGGNNYLEAPAAFNLSGSFSVALWFKPTAVSGGVSALVQNWSTGAQAGQMFLGFGEPEPPNTLFAQLSTDAGSYLLAMPELTANVWHHAALVYNATDNTLRLYHNGVQVSQVVVVGTFSASNIPLRVGVQEQAATPNDLSFLADQLGFWDRPLSVQDVQMLYNYELGKEDFTADLYGDNVSLLLHMDKPANTTAGTGEISDPNFSNVTLLLHCDGADGSTTFTDSSSNALAITAQGSAQIDTAVGVFAQSGLFDGVDAYVETATPINFAAAEDFTLETFVRFNALTAQYAPIAVQPGGWALYLFENSTLYWGVPFISNDLQYSWSPQTSVWYHVAVCRENGTLRLFIDGVLAASETLDGSYSGSGACAIAHYPGLGTPGEGYLNGHLDEFRVTTGVARYTANFTPPTAPFPDTGTNTPAPSAALLLHCDGADGSTTVTDSSSANRTITVSGNAQISTTQSKFGSGSVALGSAYDYLRANIPFDWNADFTFECWIRLNELVGGSPANTIIEAGDIGSGRGGLHVAIGPGGILDVNNGMQGAISGGTIPENEWVHLAVVLNAGTTTAYINGQSIGTSQQTYDVTNNVISIGAAPNYFFYFNGYIDEIRLLPAAVYTANFTPPTSPFSAGTLPEPDYGNVELLLHCNGANAATTFSDSSPKTRVVTANGSAQISTAQSQFGGASAYFDGINASLTTPSSSDFIPAGQAMTIECWLRPAAEQSGGGQGAGNAGAIVSLRNGPVYCSYEFSIRNDKTLQLLAYDGSGWAADGYGQTPASQTALAVDTWSHVALVINSDGETTLFINGQADPSFAQIPISYAQHPDDGDLHVGAGGDGVFNGYIDDLRITRGVVRYTANFTPPSAQFPSADVPPTPPTLITTFIDTSTHNHAVTANGSAGLTLTDIKYGNAAGEFSGGHCEIAMSPEFAFGSGDFTVEFWGKLAYNANSAVFSIADSTLEAGTYLIGFRSDPNMFGFCYDIPGGLFVAANISTHYDTWAHYAFVRAAGVLKMYVNGVEVATAETTANLNGGTQTTAVIGRRWADTDDYYLDGLIDDLRVTKGVARYVSSFNPPTKAFPDPVIATPVPENNDISENVVLLLRMNGADGSTTFVDDSYLQHAVTVQGNAAITTTESKFGGASLQLDGVESFLTVANDPLFAFTGPATFTIEAWIRPAAEQATNALPGANASYAGAIISTRSGPVYAPYELAITPDLKLHLLVQAQSSNFWNTDQISATTLTANQWHHVALVSVAGNTTLYVDGQADATLANLPQNFNPDVENLYIGVGGDGWFVGNIDSVRITRNVAVYTENFTPPVTDFSVPFIATTPANLLLHFDGTDGGTTFVDSALNPHTVTAVGGTQTSTTQSKFGGSSGYFNGIDGYLQIDTTAADNFGADNWTTECWFYPLSVTGEPRLLSRQDAGTSFVYQLRIFNGALQLLIRREDGSGYTEIGGTIPVSADQWQHVAVVRNGDNVSLYVNGVLDQTAAFTGAFNSPLTAPWIVGAFADTDLMPQLYFEGYIDELRVVKGAAIYTADFTPPTAPFKAVADVLPTDVSGCDLWLDSSAPITANNNVIAIWSDSSGNGRAATAANYAPAAIVAAGEGFNGQDVVRFAGDPNVLDVTYQFALKNSTGLIVLRQADPITVDPGFPRILSFQPGAGTDATANDGLALIFKNDGAPTGIQVWSASVELAEHSLSLPIGWTLISYTITDGVLRLRVNGEQVATGTNANMANNAGSNLYIGHGGSFLLSEAFQGDMTTVALFDHPLGEAALVALERTVQPPPPPPPGAETALLLHFDGPTVVDSSGNNVEFTLADGSFNTSLKQFGAASYSGDGYRTLHSTTQFLPDLSYADFTIECWIYRQESYQQYTSILYLHASNEHEYDYQGGLNLYVNSNGTVSCNNGYSASLDGGDVQLNEWTYIAVVRQNGTTTLYVNGIAVATDSQPPMAGPYAVLIGFVASSSNGAFNNNNQLIDELRITINAALYTENFTPPNAPFNP